MRYAQIRKSDISNGDGLGVSLFTQGCPIHCNGCHNKEIWDFNGGEKYTEETALKILDLIRKPYIKRFSILGGEPLIKNNIEELVSLSMRIKGIRPDIKIWLYTGFTYEKLLSLNDNNLKTLFSIIDILVDGDFQEDKKDIKLKFKGSSNQRIIDMNKTVEKNIVLYE